MPTGRTSSRRKAIRRRHLIIYIRRVLFMLVIIAAGVGIFLGIRKVSDIAISDQYDDSRMDSLITLQSVNPYRMPGYASGLCVVDPNVVKEEDPDFTAPAGLLCKVNGTEPIFSLNALDHMHPASTTKIMTMLLALQYGKFDETVTVTDAAMIHEAGASLADLKVGDQLTVKQLMYGLFLPSGNDAANALAIQIAGNTYAFVEMMNDEAYRLGCFGTHFTNAHGLTGDEHYTTPYDLYLMINECMKYDEFFEIASAQAYNAQYTDANGKAVSRVWKNGNKYMAKSERPPAGVRALAGKTGTTSAAGNCLVLASEDETDRYVSVVMKASDKTSLYKNMGHLLEKIRE